MNKEFSTETVLALATGRGCGALFSEVHEAIEYVMGHPVWTHEMADKELWNKVAKIVRPQNDNLIYWIDTIDGADNDAVGAIVIRAIKDVGLKLQLKSGSETRTEDPIKSLQRILS